MAWRSRFLLLLAAIAAQAVYFALAIWAWGNAQDFFADPARSAVCVASIVFTVAAFGSGANFSSGRRHDARDRWIFVPATLSTIAVAVVPPYCDRRDLWTIDGDLTRWIGLALFVIGNAYRTGAMFVLGNRFSGQIAIQEQHELVTTGLYRTIRHPSYAAFLVAMVGWVLVFRSALGLLVVASFLIPLVGRMRAEEVMLLSEFGDRYAAYRQRTWRLVPFLY